MADLPCADGAGSINNPDNDIPGTPPPEIFVPAELCVGNWELTTTLPDFCEQTDQQRQESYVAEALNINGAPINIFKLLGIHEQGEGSVLNRGRPFSSTAFPGFPLTDINGAGVWRSLELGPNTVNNSFIGIDFGIRSLSSGASPYNPHAPNLQFVGAVQITQSSDPTRWARQVKVEATTGACELGQQSFFGTGDGLLSVASLGSNATRCQVIIEASTPTAFDVSAVKADGTTVLLGEATIGLQFSSPIVNFIIGIGTIPFAIGDTFMVAIDYQWKRAGIFNLIQSPQPQTIALSSVKSILRIKALKITPTLFAGTDSWEVSAFEVLDSVPTQIDNIQDLFLNENRDRDYSKTPILLKVQYSPTDGVSDLSKFGINILDQYSFTASFNTMVQLLGRPIVTGDIIEVIPEMQYDHNLKPVRKFLEVTDTGWATEGFSTHWKPTMYRFSAQIAMPSQETRDIFGTIDTQKYFTPDSVFASDAGAQIDTTPLTIAEEIRAEAQYRVPETGSDDQMSAIAKPQPPAYPQNAKGQPKPVVKPEFPKGAQNIYMEDGLPPNGEPYGEGFRLPDMATAVDGEYFRLYYPPETKIPPRLYAFSAVKNRWIFLETDRRGEYSSHTPSVRNILQSTTKQGLGKKL